MLPESQDIKSGGDKESRPEPIDFKRKDYTKHGAVTFKAPRQEGPYRLFGYVSDGKGKAAVANIPFYVKDEL